MNPPDTAHAAPAPAPATRRRGETLQQAIFQAALQQLGELGYAKLTMERIAEAAGTGKAALYRRWNSKEDLVFDALADCLPDPAQVPAHQTVREDLLALMHCYRQLYSVSHGAAFRVFKEESTPERSRVHAMVRAAVTDPVKAKLHQALLRGVERGEVRAAAATAQTAAIGPAMMAYHCMTENPSVPDGYVEHLVDDVLLPLLRP